MVDKTKLEWWSLMPLFKLGIIWLFILFFCDKFVSYSLNLITIYSRVVLVDGCVLYEHDNLWCLDMNLLLLISQKWAMASL